MGGPQVRLRDLVEHLGFRGGQLSGVTKAAAGVVSGANGGARGASVQRPAPVDCAVAPAMDGDDVVIVTLTTTELCEGGNLFDEARRGMFRACVAEPLSGRSARSGGGGAAANLLRLFNDPDLVIRLERFVATARDVAAGLRYLHTACGMAHGDLVSRNVLLQRRPPTDEDHSCGYIAKLAGYGRQAPPPPICGGADCGGEEAYQSSTFRQLSATSLNRVNTIHVGLWRDVYSLAPERLLDPQSPPTFEADIYAYGTLLYEMAMGESPWAGMTSACVAVGTATGELRVSCSSSCALPSITALVARCTSQRHVDRPTVDEVLASLELLAEEIDGGKELAAAHRQQQHSELIIHTFLDFASV